MNKDFASVNVLVACECSQRVAKSFRELGCNAFSCDIMPCYGGHPEFHICGDVLPLIDGHCSFITSDGTVHFINRKWDLIIAHPPCTYLCNSGLRWLKNNPSRKILQNNAVEFFMRFVNADCERIAIENPVGVMSTLYRKPDQIYNPFEFFGETDCKRTCLWLKGLPTLESTQDLPKSMRTHSFHTGFFDGKQYAYNSVEIKILRSRTPWGVARAMASQWSSCL